MIQSFFYITTLPEWTEMQHQTGSVEFHKHDLQQCLEHDWKKIKKLYVKHTEKHNVVM